MVKSVKKWPCVQVSDTSKEWQKSTKLGKRCKSGKNWQKWQKVAKSGHLCGYLTPPKSSKKWQKQEKGAKVAKSGKNCKKWQKVTKVAESGKKVAEYSSGQRT